MLLKPRTKTLNQNNLVAPTGSALALHFLDVEIQGAVAA
jgi:hypothetical protein